MARWDQAQWVGPTVNQGDGDGVYEPDGDDRIRSYDMVIVHIASGYFGGTISWQRNPVARVSSHIVAGRNGQRAQVVDTAVRAWTQSNGNSRCLSIENEGFAPDDDGYIQGWETLTPQQIETNAAFLAWAHKTHGIPLQLTNDPDNGRGLGWHGMGGTAWGGHFNCPGIAIRAQLPQILARAMEIVNGDDMATIDQADWDRVRWDDYDVNVAGNDANTGGPSPGRALWLPRFLKALDAKVTAIAAKVDIDPAELVAIQEAAKTGAAQALAGWSAADIAAAISDDLAQEVVDALAARLAAKQP